MPLSRIQPYSRSDFPWHFDGELHWNGKPETRRSSELTPLYIIRYVGAHRMKHLDIHPYWELTYVFRGKGLLHTDRAVLPLKPGHAYLLPPGTMHREEAQDQVDTLWIGIHAPLLIRLNGENVWMLEAPELNTLAEQLWLLSERGYGLIGPEMDGLCRALLARFVRQLSDRDPSSDLLDQSIDFLRKHYARPLSIHTLVEKFGYSEGYFFRLFKKRTGMTPHEYLTRIRLEHALILMRHSTLTLSEVSKLVGYRDPLYFSRIFKKTLGKNPRLLRRGLRKQAGASSVSTPLLDQKPARRTSVARLLKEK